MGQIVADPSPPRTRDSESVSKARLRAAAPRLDTPVGRAIAICVGLALLSSALLPTVPSYDPFAWVVWGRLISEHHLATGGGPSWKPFPVIFTTIWGLFGGAAPTLWVITARAGGLLGLAGGWRLATRLGGRIAGLVAVLGIVLTQDWAYYMFRGTSEPMLIATTVWAVERHLAGKRVQAFVLLVAASLIRPEAWPFLGLYGVWLAWNDRGLWWVVALGWLAIPFFWFVPPWISTGQPFMAASHAKSYNGHLGSHPWLEALRRAADLQVAPMLAAAAVGVALTWFKERDRLIIGLLSSGLAWVVLVEAMTIGGYPGLERFFLPAAAVFCVLAGVGVSRVAMLAGGGVRTLGVAVVILAASVPFATARIDAVSTASDNANRAVKLLNQLSSAVHAAGGKAGVLPCRTSVTAVNHAVQTALAWKLHVTLARVGTSLRRPGVTFIGPNRTGVERSVDGAPAPIRFHPQAGRLVATAGPWRVLRVTRPGVSDACAGR